MHRVSSTENHSWSWLHRLLWVTRSSEPKEHIEWLSQSQNTKMYITNDPFGHGRLTHTASDKIALWWVIGLVMLTVGDCWFLWVCSIGNAVSLFKLLLFLFKVMFLSLNYIWYLIRNHYFRWIKCCSDIFLKWFWKAQYLSLISVSNSFLNDSTNLHRKNKHHDLAL